jgi:aarF domain-containing kinase
MAARRLLDFAKVVSASRSITRQHVALRRHQLDVYTRTSTTGKILKDQIDRTAVAAQAFTAIAKRLAEDAPSYLRDDLDDQNSASPRQESVRGDSIERNQSRSPAQDCESQDHLRKPTPGKVDDSPLQDELEIKQEKPDRYPLPDGTIPLAGTNSALDTAAKDTYDQRPEPEPAKRPLVDQDDNNNIHGRRSQENLVPISSHASTIPVPKKAPLPSTVAKKLQREAENQIPAVTAATQPLRDKTIKSDVYSDRPQGSDPPLSSLPRIKFPKNSSIEQGSIDTVNNAQINADVYYKPASIRDGEENPISHKGDVATPNPKQDDIPQGVNINVFSNPRIARMLGGGSYSSMKDNQKLRSQNATGTPLDQENLFKGRGYGRPNEGISHNATLVETATQQAKNTTEQPIEAHNVQDVSPNISIKATAAEDHQPLYSVCQSLVLLERIDLSNCDSGSR